MPNVVAPFGLCVAKTEKGPAYTCPNPVRGNHLILSRSPTFLDKKGNFLSFQRNTITGGCQDTQHNDTQCNGIQHNDTQHNDTQHNDTQHTGRGSLCQMSLTLSVIYA